MANNTPMIAEGNIAPRRVVAKGAASFGVIQSTASPGGPPLGISCEALRRGPNSPFDDGFAAITGEEIRVYQLDEFALADVGSNSISAWDFVKSDANGRVVTASTADFYVGQAIQSATASQQQILVKVQPGTL